MNAPQTQAAHTSEQKKQTLKLVNETEKKETRAGQVESTQISREEAVRLAINKTG